ncbi:unnamed protein product [Thelazia callipaeda]|uniref:Mitochondrial import inner membrane translocase subunit TIM50 n=1 Tax=Thelazia callipaeda TaxID=103827 RepID=A0A0N5D258_THECL|nr:unnamed protein product [Thelazia callipaeda]
MFVSSSTLIRVPLRSVSKVRKDQGYILHVARTLIDPINKLSSESNGIFQSLLQHRQICKTEKNIRLLSGIKSAIHSKEDLDEKKTEKDVWKESEYENLGNLDVPKVEVKPNILVCKWEALMNSCGLPVDRTAPQEDQNAQKRKRSTVLAMFIVAGSTLCGILYFCIYYGWMRKDENNTYTGILAPFYRIKEAYRSWRNVSHHKNLKFIFYRKEFGIVWIYLQFVIEPSRDKLLPDPIKPPYWQPKYTVVIEFKNILVAPEWSYKMGNRVKKRPAVDYLLDVIGYPNFEVVIYTSETALNANSIIEALDTKQKIMYKLYRDCCKYMNGVYVKDLSKLNRDLSKVIYIDFDPESFQLSPENVLRLPKWNGELDDTALVDLAELLKTIHLSDVDDVRPTLQYYSQFDDPLKEFRERATRIAEIEKKIHENESEKEAFVAPVKKYQGHLFGFRRHE